MHLLNSVPFPVTTTHIYVEKKVTSTWSRYQLSHKNVKYHWTKHLKFNNFKYLISALVSIRGCLDAMEAWPVGERRFQWARRSWGNSQLFVSRVDMEKNKWKSSFFFWKMIMSNGRTHFRNKIGRAMNQRSNEEILFN